MPFLGLGLSDEISSSIVIRDSELIMFKLIENKE